MTDNEEIKAVAAAMCRWMNSQEIPIDIGACAMARVLGLIIGRKAEDAEDVIDGVDRISVLITNVAIFAMKDRSEI